MAIIMTKMAVQHLPIISTQERLLFTEVRSRPGFFHIMMPMPMIIIIIITTFLPPWQCKPQSRQCW